MIKYEIIQVQNILNRLSDKFDGFSAVYTLNPYKGCEHACQYCYVLSEKYVPYKKKEEFFYKIQSKTNAAFLLNESLKKIPQDALIMIGSACDPYQPAEQTYKNTRNILEVIYRYKNPVHIMTKSDLILRDIDILSKISAASFLAVSFSIIADDDLSEIFEPRAPKPSKRFKAMKILSSSGIRCGVAISPVCPYIVKEETVKDIIVKANLSGAKYVFSDDLRLRDINKERFFAFVKKFYPKLFGRYEIIYSKRISPPVIFSKKLNELIEKMSADLGMDTTLTGKTLPKIKKIQPELFE
ncbi:MAG: radical SAM protein [Elusimicrobiota bacterium]